MRRPLRVAVAVAITALGAAAIGGAVAAIPPSGAEPVVVGVEEVMEARDRAAERFGRERVERLVQSDGRRIAESGLPSPAYRGVLPEGEWSTVASTCVRELEPMVTSVDLRVDAAGELVEWSIVQPGTEPFAAERPAAFERLALAVRVCAVRHLPAVPALGGIDDVERAWWRDDALTRLLPCLRRAGGGLVASTPPERLAERAAEGRPWDPLTGLDPATRARAAVLCPPGETLLDRADPRSEAGADRVRAPRPLTRIDVPVADF